MALLGVVLALTGACADLATGSPAGDEIRLRVVLADDWAATVPVDEAVRAFEAAHRGVRVEIDGLPFGDIAAAVDAASQSGAPYDLAHWHAFAAGARGLSQPVSDLWQERLDPHEFLPGAIGDVFWGDEFHGVPLDVNAMILMANQDHLDAAGLEGDLATFGDVSGAAAALSVAGERRGIAHGLSTWAAYGWIRANGGEVVDVDIHGTPTFLLDSPATIEALTWLQAQVGDGVAHPPAVGVGAVGARELFNGGLTSLIATGSWDLVTASRRALAEDLDAPAAVALPMPMGPSADSPGTALGGSSLFVPIGSEHRQLAFELALALIEDDVALALAQEEGRLPARRRLYDAPFFSDPTMQVVRAHLEFARPMRLVAFREAQFAFSQAIERILVLGESPADVLAEAQRVAEASVADRP